MKPDYKNWMPKWMVVALCCASIVLLAALVAIVLWMDGLWKIALTILLAAGTLLCVGVTAWMMGMYRAFSYTGKRQLSRQIIEGTAACVTLPAGGKCLDVGCGSGALSIAVAKRNPQAAVIGMDRWGAEYAFSQGLCERNARAEGVHNVTFQQGNAVRLDFPDETFDGVVSNYVYHNIPGDRKPYLLETLRTLKKGGCFAIHDLFSPSRYGDMQPFIQKLRQMGYQQVALTDTTDGRFMEKREAARMLLTGSALLTGIK